MSNQYIIFILCNRLRAKHLELYSKAYYLLPFDCEDYSRLLFPRRRCLRRLSKLDVEHVSGWQNIPHSSGNSSLTCRHEVASSKGPPTIVACGVWSHWIRNPHVYPSALKSQTAFVHSEHPQWKS